jgi:hypothetical protein
MAQQRLKAARVKVIHTNQPLIHANHPHRTTNHCMKSICFHRYRSVLIACATALLAALAVPLANASDSLAGPGAASAALRTPMISLADDGKDMKETKEVKKEAGPLFDVLLNVEFADKYVTPRGQIVRDRGLTIQPLALIFLNAYKGDGFINSFTIVAGAWSDFGTSLVSKRGNPATPYPKTNWSEFDPIYGISVGFAKRFKLDVTYTAFVERYHDIDTSHHLETKLSFDDSDFLKAFALHPYASYWQELSGKSTAADVGEAVFGPSTKSGNHPNPGSSFYFEIGIDPGYTFANFGDLKIEAPCHIMLADDRFFGNYFGSSSTLALWEAGLKASIPLKFVPGPGHWSVHAGFKYLGFEDVNLQNMQVFNDPGKSVQDTWQAYGGISVFF